MKAFHINIFSVSLLNPSDGSSLILLFRLRCKLYCIIECLSSPWRYDEYVSIVSNGNEWCWWIWTLIPVQGGPAAHMHTFLLSIEIFIDLISTQIYEIIMTAVFLNISSWNPDKHRGLDIFSTWFHFNCPIFKKKSQRKGAYIHLTNINWISCAFLYKGF